MHHYPHHIADFDRATRHLSRLERSIYRDMLDLYYDTEQQLTLDKPKLCKLILATSNEEVTAVEFVLNEFFNETVNGFYNERCEFEIDRFHTNNSQKAQAGKASAAKRALKRQQALNEKLTGVEIPFNENLTNQNQNHKPEPIKKISSFVPPIPSELLSDWLVVRKDKRAGRVTETVWKGIVRESGKAGITPEHAIMICCERGWQSFNAGWNWQASSFANSKDEFYETRKQMANKLFGGNNGTHRQTIDVTHSATIESDGEGIAKIGVGIR